MRLRAALLDAFRRLTALEQKLGAAADGNPIVEACRRCLRRADAEADRKARFVAWDCLHQFNDEILAAMSAEELATHWCTLRAEAKEKLKGSWRADAAECLTKQVDEKKPVTFPIARELQAHLATTAQNQQFKFELFERRSLPWLTGLLAVAVVVALAFSYIVFTTDRLTDLLPWAKALVLGIPAGALGGILSTAFSLGRADLKAKIPDMRLSKLVTGTRPLLGATVAIPVLVFVQAGYVKFAGFEGTLAILAFCFLAGFSERWFLGLMERFESGKK